MQISDLENEETRKYLSEIDEINGKIGDLQKEKASLRRKHQSALGKLITAHVREQISKSISK